MSKTFPAPTAFPVFYRTYSRRTPRGARETWPETCDRTLSGLARLGSLTAAEVDLLTRHQTALHCLPSGRWLWVGGTPWVEQPANFPGAYNCTSTNITSWESLADLMDLAMMGCGTGAVLESHYVSQLPPVRNLLLPQTTPIGTSPGRQEDTSVSRVSNLTTIRVGDSRRGWVDSYLALLRLASEEGLEGIQEVQVDLSAVRAAGEPLKGFGGVANPVKLSSLYGRCARILNRAVGRQLTPLEVCLLIDEAAMTVVAGNIRRSAGMRQFSADDQEAAMAKQNLWQQGSDGQWRIDPERDALRMANHTRVFHRKPTLQECIDSVRSQYHSGEGAIQWAGEAVARANVDLVKGRKAFLASYPNVNLRSDRMARYGLNPCGEIIGSNFFCNLSEIHLNTLNPADTAAQKEAFRAGGLWVAALLHHKLTNPVYRKSRKEDPIVGVSFTGLFDFFVNAFGVEWLEWWAQGRPLTPEGLGYRSAEADCLRTWRRIAHDAVWSYCDRHHLKRPNRCTTVQPAGTKSLLTGASPGWHPPKAARFIRRITFRRGDPVALACLDYGYSVVPSQSDKDEDGRLLDDPYHPRCTEWLVEIPVATSWADLPGCDQVDISRFSALAQFDFYMQVQRHYTTHNTSATIELREAEIEALGARIHQAIQEDEGYVSAALLARFDSLETFPRLPFEPVSKERYQELMAGVEGRRKTADFGASLQQYDFPIAQTEAGPAGCDSDKCLFPA